MSAPGRKLSVALCVHNEAAQLADCLETLTFADEIVVVLDRCTDASKEVAKKFAARTVEGAWQLEGPRRHAAIDLCSGDWILEVDADERAPQALGQEIRHTIENAKPSFTSANRPAIRC